MEKYTNSKERRMYSYSHKNMLFKFWAKEKEEISNEKIELQKQTER